jgi:hypothetical protein
LDFWNLVVVIWNVLGFWNLVEGIEYTFLVIENLVFEENESVFFFLPGIGLASEMEIWILNENKILVNVFSNVYGFWSTENVWVKNRCSENLCLGFV